MNLAVEAQKRRLSSSQSLGEMIHYQQAAIGSLERRAKHPVVRALCIRVKIPTFRPLGS